MIGLIGQYAVIAAFFSALLACVFYFRSAQNNSLRDEHIGTFFLVTKGSLIFLASGILVYLLFTHQFQYFYVYNTTSLDLQNVYIWASFYSGQEGSFLLWILLSFLISLGILRWTEDTYRAPVMFFLLLSQIFLISMVAGLEIGDLTIGASPFRTLATEMPNAPVFQSNPDFVPADGSGLNDLLRSPWIVIHPPILFLGFAMMTVPFAFAFASLWKRKYNEWIHPALPWTLGANLCLLTAIFLGGYWAYVTLSFGGYWAWDPVENASLVPWIFGLAGIHAMLIQRTSAIAQKASILFAILAYMAVVYSTFLTRSGILGEASFHSFVDLGLYNQLLLFLVVTTVIGIGMFIYRYRELPSPDKEAPFISREFMMFSGSMLLFLCGLVIMLGTSSPVLGRLFVSNPTPPAQEFYNAWMLPFAVIITISSVLGQFLWWKKYNAESLSAALILPSFLTSIATIATVILSNIDNLAYMIYLFAGYFSLIGNGIIMIRLIKRNPKIIGGTVTHIGFAIMMIGFLGAAYDRPMLDQSTRQYNASVRAGQVEDEDGFTVNQTVEYVELELDKPKLLDGRYMVTYKGGEVINDRRPGEQMYYLQFEDTEGKHETFTMSPTVYPMIANSSPGAVEWTVDPEVRSGILSDIYMYVAGSSMVEKEIERMEAENQQGLPSITDMGKSEEKENQISIKRGSQITYGDYTFEFEDFIHVPPDDLPANSIIGVMAKINVEHIPSGENMFITPLFSIIDDGEDQVSYSPPVSLEPWNASIQFLSVNPQSEEIELYIDGIEGTPQREWILIAAERKPFISVVWLGTFILMFGFSISIFRRWTYQKKREKKEIRKKQNESKPHIAESEPA
ncbi:MAG: cytochrome c biogenesis protein CcsA [Balneolales bacterium]